MPVIATGPSRGASARGAVLAAGRSLFLAEGFRRTSIEAIARAAGVSRPTVYAHFASKEEIFRTLVADLHHSRLAAMEEAARQDGTVETTLYRALAVRFVPFVELTASSPHGVELLDENSRVCGDLTRASRRQSLKLLTGLLARAATRGELDLAALGLSPSAAAAVVYDCARGAKEDADTTRAAYRRRLRRIVAVVLHGMAAPPGR